MQSSKGTTPRRLLTAFLAATSIILATYATASAQRSSALQETTVGGQFSSAEYTLRASAKFGGAVYSLRWGAKEFINSFDKGRELQSAASFNNWGECYNPTEAGSAADSTGPRSTSKLISIASSPTELTTRSQMAFWLAPGKTSRGCPGGITAKNTTELSDFVFAKRIQLAAAGIPNAIDHNVVFSVPRSYDSGVFAALTAYMAPEFSTFWTFNPETRERARINSGPGEQSLPLIFSTSDGLYAYGVYSSELPQPSWGHVGYGRWDFTYARELGSPTVKWNCVFREKGIKPGDYSYRCTSIFGTLQDVEKAMMELHRLRGRKAQ